MKNKEKYDLSKLKIKWRGNESIEIYADDGVYRLNSNNNSILLRGLVNWLEQEYKEPPILDGEGREYLSAVIRPWRNKVISIVKMYCVACEYIVINYDDEGYIETVVLPFFKAGTMYKGMELNKEYSIEKLKI